MAVLQRYRMLVIVYVIVLGIGTREYLVSRSGGTLEWISGCQASAAACSTTGAQTSGTSDDSLFWTRHAEMTEVVAQLNPEDPDTDFLLGMQALSEGDVEESIRRLEEALEVGAKHNNYLLQYYAQYELSRGADWRRVNRAVNRWRINHPFSADPLTIPLGAGPETPRDENEMYEALEAIPWLAGSKLESFILEAQPRWQISLVFQPGETVDVREAIEAVTLLSLPPNDRQRFRVRCSTLVDCTMVPR